MTIDERATNYAIEIYGWEDAFKSSITPSLIAARGYARGAEDEKKILVERAWRYLASRLEVVVLGTDGLVVLQGGINEEEFRKLMLTFKYDDNDCAEDIRAAAQKYADIYNEASLNHDTEKLDKLETISEFSNILKKKFADIVKEQYNSDDIGYIDFDNQANYTKGSIEHTIEELFTKYKSIQEKDVIPSLSNFWCNGEMCIVRILYGHAEVYIA